MPQVKETDQANREAFRERYRALRDLNKDLSEQQRQARLTKKEEKKLPVPERSSANMQGKDRETALEITVILRLMRTMRGLSQKYRPLLKCRLCRHSVELPERDIHRIRPEDKNTAERIRYSVIQALKLDPFLK